MAAILSAAASCSSTPADLEQKASTLTETRRYDLNYQEVYRRLYGTANRCITGPAGSFEALKVDGQIYTELGFAEVTISLVSYGNRNYYVSSRIEKEGAGTKLVVHSGNSLSRGVTLRQVIGWAEGNESCQ